MVSIAEQLISRHLLDEVYDSSNPKLQSWKQYFVDTAKNENQRIQLDGKVIWSAIGNPSGLHSYIYTLIREKYAKSGKNFEKKLDKWLESGKGEITLFWYKNITRDRGKWVAGKKFDLKTFIRQAKIKVV